MRISEALKEAQNHIPTNEARILLEHVTGKTKEYIIMHDEEVLYNKDIENFLSLINRRKNKEPIAYITGVKEFYSNDFFVNQNVLIPRPDTEILVESVIEHIKKNQIKKPEILELGIGSGCITLSILLEVEEAISIGVDISDNVLEIARKNIQKFKLEERCKLIKSDWFENITGQFNIIISNPPYIDKKDINIISDETYLHEPKLALFADNNGYFVYEEIAKSAKKHLVENGEIFLEIGLNQEEKVKEIFISENFHYKYHVKDLAGIIRCLVFSL